MKIITKVGTLLILLGVLITYFSCDDNNLDCEIPHESTDILTFTLEGQVGNAIIDTDLHTVDVEVALGTSLTDLTATFTISPGSTSVPPSGTSRNYTDGEVRIRVTDEDEVTYEDWTVNVTEELPPPNDATEILLFKFDEQTSLAVFNRTNKTIEIEVANGTDLTNLTPEFLLSKDATSDPASGTPGDYSIHFIITVTAEDGTTTEDWKVVTTEAPNGPSNQTDILYFTMEEATQDAVISPDAHTVTLEVATGTNLADLTPLFILSPGAISIPPSGTSLNFNAGPVTIRVRAEDGQTVQDWDVTVYAEDDFDPVLFCNQNLCTDDEDRQEECRDGLIECLSDDTEINYEECVLYALIVCNIGN